MNDSSIRKCLWAAIAISIALFSANAAAQARKPIAVEKARVVEHWTKERRAAAIPRDLVIDERGLGYLRLPDGSLRPYGHDVAALEAPRAQTPSPFAKQGGSGDTTPPTISAMNPAAGVTIGTSYTFSATVKDRKSGVASVTFSILQSDATNSYPAAKTSGDTWSASVSGLTNGPATWWVVAVDNANNTRTSGNVNFTVGTSSGGGGGTVTNAHWTTDSAIKKAAGRVYFEMPGNSKHTIWWGYVCSGTVADDTGGKSGRSVIITAAHCVYDDVYKVFARNVMFIPDQDSSGTATDRDCSNDRYGCWVPSFGVVDVDWTNKTFPANIPWDYAFYVVPDSGAHRGNGSNEILDAAVGSFPVITRDIGVLGGYTYALGYSYSDDPNFMYCAESVAIEGDYKDWWLPSCLLSGGSSGGPWVQNGTSNWIGGTDNAGIISVNSWGFQNSAGMGGPRLYGTTAERIFCNAKNSDPSSDPRGIVVTSESTTCPY